MKVRKVPVYETTTDGRKVSHPSAKWYAVFVDFAGVRGAPDDKHRRPPFSRLPAVPAAILAAAVPRERAKLASAYWRPGGLVQFNARKMTLGERRFHGKPSPSC